MTAWEKNFSRVCGMCLSHVWCYVFDYCILYGNWVPDGYDDFIIGTAK